MVKRRLETDFQFNLEVIGIIASLKEYKVAWLLNEHLEMNLVKQPDEHIELKGNKSITISNFLFENDLTIFRLLKNRLSDISQTKKTHLINSLNQFDYLITIDDQSGNFEIEKCKNTINSIDLIQYSAIIDINKLKEKENLIL